MKEYKGYNIAQDMGSHLSIKNIGKGTLPKALRGLYTSHMFAKRAIDQYLSEKGVEENGTKEDISRV